MNLLGQPCRNRPAEFARCTRCPPGACQRRLLPLPVSVMLIFKHFSYVSGQPYFVRRLQARNYKPPLKGEGDQRSWWRGSAEIFTPVLGFTEETPQSAYGCQLPFQGSLLRKLLVCSRAVASKLSGGIRSLPSLSAWGLPTPVVALACIGNVDIQVFFWYRWVTLFCTAFASLHSLGGGGFFRKVISSRAVASKLSGGIRSLPSLSAWGLPTPIVDLACIGNVDIQAFFLCKRSTLFCTAFASWWRDSFVYPPQQPADFTRSYASFFLY